MRCETTSDSTDWIIASPGVSPPIFLKPMTLFCSSISRNGRASSRSANTSRASSCSSGLPTLSVLPSAAEARTMLRSSSNDLKPTPPWLANGFALSTVFGSGRAVGSDRA